MSTGDQDHQIIVAYDGSESSAAAVDWAAAEAGQSRRPLTVLHVDDHRTLVVRPGGHRTVLDTGGADRVAREGTDRARRLARTVDVRARTVSGRVAPALIDVSRAAELLVVGTRGRGDLTGSLLGSVAFTVSAQARCPVVVVRGDSTQSPDPETPVVVGTDGSRSSRTAVAYAADAAARTRAALIVVTAYRPEPAWDPTGTTECDFGPPAATPPDLRADPRESAVVVSSTDVQLARYLHPGIDIQAKIVLGDTVGQLCTAAHRAGLLVVGTRARGALSSLLLGSVGHGLIRSAPCPVAVVHSSAAT